MIRINKQLCPPAADISKALFTFSWPLTSEKSIRYFSFFSFRISLFSSFFIFFSLFKNCITSIRFSAGIISIPVTYDASFAFSFGNIILFIPNFFASIHIGNIPFTFSIFPFSDNSPINMLSFRNSSNSYWLMCPLATNIPMAIAKSRLEPSFLVFAGAKFTTILLLRNSAPEFFIAVFTLSFDSLTLVSGKPYYFEIWHSWRDVYLY